MDKERRVALQNKYGLLLPDASDGGLMTLTFQCGDSWMSILEALFAKIDDEVKKANLIGFKVVQVKEKLGDLVVCVLKGNDAINALIVSASKRAARTCEDCGKPGRKRELNEWYSTQCSKCYAGGCIAGELSA